MTTEKRQVISKITQNTLIPLSLVFFIGGGMFWLSKISFTSENNSRLIIEMQKDLKRIDRTTARFEGLLKNLGGSGG